MTAGTRSRLTLRTLALGYLFVLVLVPLGMIFYRTFEHGLVGVLGVHHHAGGDLGDQHVADHRGDRRAAERGLRRRHGARAGARALPRARHACRRSSTCRSPISPVIVGVSLMLLWGVNGWFGGLADAGFQVIFSLPGMVLATLFVTLPFVVREVEPVLHEIGDEQEQAAATLGASRWQTFWRITLPAIRWGLAYGVVLTVARALGEFGAVTVVAGGVPGESQTLTLLVHSRYIDDQNTFGAYAAATVLMGLALVTLLLMTAPEPKREAA